MYNINEMWCNVTGRVVWGRGDDYEERITNKTSKGTVLRLNMLCYHTINIVLMTVSVLFLSLILFLLQLFYHSAY